MVHNMRCKWSDRIGGNMNTHESKLLYALSEHVMSLQDLVDDLRCRMDSLDKQTTLYGPKRI